MKQFPIFDDKNLYEQLNPNDVVFTPDHIAKMIVDRFKPTGFCLDPCMGEGAFFQFLPIHSREWCEITKGRDFFDYQGEVDWIISNPPYSNFNEFLAHSFELSPNVVYLTPIAKIFKSWATLQIIKKYGGIKTILFDKASRCGFPFGFPVGSFHFIRNYKGLTSLEYVI